jgi:hypothetical protein
LFVRTKNPEPVFSGNRAQFMAGAGAGVEALRRKGGDTGSDFRVYLQVNFHKDFAGTDVNPPHKT